MNVGVLQHVPFETPRTFGTALLDAGHEISTRLVPQEGLPDGDEDALLIMGGPMSVNDPHPWIAEELQYIAAAMQREIPVVGICLGSQLIARAAGGTVYPGDGPEIGLCEVSLTEAGRADPFLAGIPETVSLIQWHGQGIRVPETCTILAGSNAFPVQAFRAAPRVYGLLFHLELDQDALETLCREFPEDVRASGKSTDAILAEAQPHLPTLQGYARRFLLGLLEGPA